MLYDLVLSGGGVKSIAFLGALQEFKARDHVVGRLLGTSAGGATAAMLACGYTSQEISEAIYDVNMERPSFADLITDPSLMIPTDLRNGAIRTLLQEHDSRLIPNLVEQQLDTLLFEVLLKSPLLHPLFSFVQQGYWYSDASLLEWLKRVFDSGTFRGTPRRFSDMTLKEFYHATEIELSLVVSDITEVNILILNHYTAPDCPLVWALRMSAGLPMLWEDVVWRDAWGTYSGRDISGHHLIDGEVLSPFPIELFFSDLPEVTAWVGKKRTPHVLGLVIDEKLPVPGAQVCTRDENRKAIEELPLANSLMRIFDAILQVRNKSTIEAVERHIVHLPAKGYHMLDFQLNRSRFNALVKAGRSVTQRYFSQQATDAESINTDLLFPSSPSALQYINESAKQQLSHVGIVNNYYIHTGGGAYIGGNVEMDDGTFVGRDNNPT